MNKVVFLYKAIIVALAVVAGAMIAAMCLLIIYDVGARTLGAQPPYWTSALVEYSLLYITLLASPWLLWRKGHVYVQVLYQFLPKRHSIWFERLVYLVCILICIVFCVSSTMATAEALVTGEFDVRSVMVPMWVLYAPMPISFGLLGLGFCRFLFGPESFFDSSDAIQESL